MKKCIIHSLLTLLLILETTAVLDSTIDDLGAIALVPVCAVKTSFGLPITYNCPLILTWGTDEFEYPVEAVVTIWGTDSALLSSTCNTRYVITPAKIKIFVYLNSFVH